MTEGEALQFLRDNQPLPLGVHTTQEQVDGFIQATTVLSGSTEPEVASLALDSLQERSWDGAFTCVETLLETLPPELVTEEFRSRLASPAEQRELALVTLLAGPYADSSMIGLLEPLIEQGEGDVRLWAALDLGMIATPDSRAILERTLQKEEDPDVRESIAMALQVHEKRSSG